MSFAYIETYVADRIGYIVLNRPDKRNAFNHELVAELKTAFAAHFADDNCKVLILKAKGDVFSAGADLGYLKSLQKNSFEENLADSRHLMALYQLIYEGPKVVISQIEGSAIAGGCGLATVTDFSFAVPAAKFGYTEVRIGFIPAIVMVFLSRKLGEGKARELLLTGDLLDAQEALRYGLINFVVNADEIAQQVYLFAQKLIANCSGTALATTKKMLARVQDMPYADGLAYAAEQNAHARASSDCQLGISRFLNKEKNQW